MENTECDAIIQRLLDGTSSTEDVRRLRAAAAADPAVGARLADLVAVDRLLGQTLAGADGERRFTAEVVGRIKASDVPWHEEEAAEFVRGVQRRLSLRARRRWQVGLAAAAMIALLATVFFRRGDERMDALLVRTEAAVWEGSGAAPVTGKSLEVGRTLRLGSGLVELGFPSGVTVLIEGPAVFRIDAADAMWLERGRIFADVVRPEGRGFTVDGPGGRVVDLGTRFGVSVDAGGKMEVHVLQGKVEATPTRAGEQMIPLGRDEGLRMDGREVNRIRAEESDFVTTLPPPPRLDAGFIRWDFEELDGPRFFNSGHGLAPELATAEMRAGEFGGALPLRVAGARGKAVAFDGKSAYIEAPFRGIGGSGARTVALWVRVPPDLSIAESYALIGWGDVTGSGTAWQVSINPVSADGAVGCLRAGTGHGAVVGSTELRDGRWHHVAAVMYGGPSASTATHVLLYVDGALEATTRKSIREIRTDVETAGHGIWIGRNLSAWSPEPPGARFFRGEIDGIHLADTALGREEIRELMR